MLRRILKRAIRKADQTNKGVGLRNKALVLLLATFPSHPRLRHLIFRLIGWLADGETVDVLFRDPRAGIVTFSLRRNNAADYNIASEFLMGGNYPAPTTFTPKEIIDGGANIGLFSVLAGLSYPKARLICYEPDRSNVAQLRRNLLLNGINAEIQPVGLWSKDTNLYYRARESHTGIISEEAIGIPIKVVCPRVGPMCWMKLDVETAEYEIIPALIKNNSLPRLISMEVHHYTKYGINLVSLLRQNGYLISGLPETTADYVNLQALLIT
jgi:FkbM family methyltransferase